jgi:cAMP-dependent protein kinase regulator
VSVLSALRTQELQRLAEVLTEVHFEAGDNIIDQGAAGDTFYVLVSGAAVCTIADGSGGQVEVMRLAPFDYFGERALLSGEPRAASVRVLHAAEGGDAEGARCLHIGRAAFEEVLGSLRDIIDADRKEREVAAAASIRIGGGGGGGGGKKGKKGKAVGAVRMDDVQMTLGGGRR